MYNVHLHVPRRWTDGSSNISCKNAKNTKIPYFIGNTIKLVVFVSKTAVLGLFFPSFFCFPGFPVFHFRVRFHFLKRIKRNLLLFASLLLLHSLTYSLTHSLTHSLFFPKCFLHKNTYTYYFKITVVLARRVK
jgi:hypothetical protein